MVTLNSGANFELRNSSSGLVDCGPQAEPAGAPASVLFPYAGGTASVFRDWSDGLPADVEVCPVQFHLMIKIHIGKMNMARICLGLTQKNIVNQ